MNNSIQITVKPDWISWEDIKECLHNAHAENRSRGIKMTHYLWPAEEIKNYLGKDGVMLVALDGEKLVGTAAIAMKEGRTWYAHGSYAYMCFACVLPNYRGLGLYQKFLMERETIAKSIGCQTLLMDTHSKNIRIQKAAKKNGYKKVRKFQAKSKDHYSVIMVKWLEEHSPSKLFCWWKYQLSIIKIFISSKILHR